MPQNFNCFHQLKVILFFHHLAYCNVIHFRFVHISDYWLGFLPNKHITPSHPHPHAQNVETENIGAEMKRIDIGYVTHDDKFNIGSDSFAFDKILILLLHLHAMAISTKTNK